MTVPPGPFRGLSPYYRSRTADERGSWSHWWSWHKEDYLVRAAKEARRPAFPPEAADPVLADLRTVLQTTDAPGVRVACLIALGRSSRSNEDFDFAAASLLDADPRVREAAALALGLLGRPEAFLPLAALVRSGHPWGALRHESLRDRRRLPVFACFGLGLLVERCGDPAVAAAAAREMASMLRRPDLDPSLAQVAVLVFSLTATGADTADRELMASLLVEPGRHGRVRGQAARALGRWAVAARPAVREAVAHRLLSILDSHGLPLTARCAVLESLGALAPAATEEVLRAAVAAWDGAAMHRGHRALPGTAVMAMARCASALPPGHPTLRILRDRLRAGLNSAPLDLRSWYALALGVLADARQRRWGEAPPGGVRQALERDAVALSWEFQPGARFVALGLIGDPRSAEAARVLPRRADGTTRGYAALALGLIGSQDGELRRRLVVGSERRPTLAAQALLGLGLDPSVAEPSILLQHVGSDRRGRPVLAELAAWSTATGLGRDRRVLPGLTLLALRPDAEGWSPALVQAYAVAALGLMLDRQGRPWCSVFTREIHFLSLPPSFSSTRGDGVLDLL